MLSATHRYREKCITTILYRPVWSSECEGGLIALYFMRCYAYLNEPWCNHVTVMFKLLNYTEFVYFCSHWNLLYVGFTVSRSCFKVSTCQLLQIRAFVHKWIDVQRTMFEHCNWIHKFHISKQFSTPDVSVHFLSIVTCLKAWYVGKGPLMQGSLSKLETYRKSGYVKFDFWVLIGYENAENVFVFFTSSVDSLACDWI